MCLFVWHDGDVPTPSRAADARDSPAGDRALAAAFKALGDPTRLRLVQAITASEDGELCVCHLTEIAGLSQATVSHHMRRLVEAQLATREQRGKWAYYRLNRDGFTHMANSLRIT
ncbi:MAG: metalloregulator ArsR/SmtB family transcription factor [Bifidobacteriaceae bacterium]|jgi:ArsR family transcriptional regulator|nr:metalloregulator ArsR/SmtB family transcription factor [Bifidobacteriaceae bacterium]